MRRLLACLVLGAALVVGILPEQTPVPPALLGPSSVRLTPALAGLPITHHLILSAEGKVAKRKGWSPQDLWNAYGLAPLTAPIGGTVAVVDAYDAPTLGADLAHYRAQFHLPPLLPGQFRKVAQDGSTDYPAANADWAVETSLDAQMVTAMCPSCRIIMVEAAGADLFSLLSAEQQAASYHPVAISNSWGSAEPAPPKVDPCRGDAQTYGMCLSLGDGLRDLAQAFYFPHIAVTVSSGDSGYGTSLPADSPYVIAVGGTSLRKDPTSPRGWRESAWNGAGSGCSYYTAKPPWQNDAQCRTRTVADVAFVADPYTGVSVYDSTPYWSHRHKKWMKGWIEVGGTSVGAPAIAGLYGLANNVQDMPRGPGDFLYTHRSAFNDTVSGTNAPFMTGYHQRSYLITSQAGYDGPTGLGSPKGIEAF